jgi:dolichol-phosphate mannosyltransferase
MVEEGIAMHSNVSIAPPDVADIEQVSEQAALLIDFGPANYKHEQPSLSIVIPTRNETDNIEPLVDALKQALADVAMEIIFVDDSDDGTVAAIERVQAQGQCAIKLIHRPTDRRNNGLSGAVVEGLRAARADWVCVMDADLQHPPEIISKLSTRANEANADLVVASRYCAQGDTGNFSRKRTIVSRISASVAALLFPKRLRGVTDPMTGFFLLRKSAIDIEVLQPHGFKILLEILVRNPGLHVAEVGFHFGERHAGKSKASLTEGKRYLSHLWRLRFGETSLQFVLFLLVGISGLVVNTLVLALATERFGLHYLMSALLATQASTLWNFALTERWVFADRQRQRGWVMRLAIFLLMNNLALTLRGPMLYLFTSLIGIHYLMSNLISLAALTVVRYTIADNLIWGRGKSKKYKASIFNYDIHGIISVVSDAWLPELERFLTNTAIDKPTIRVQIGKQNVKSNVRVSTPELPSMQYHEGLGPFGFGISITLGDTIDVIATPILRWSPHVLYTNVVEPILRWTFVQRGYALVHGACISFGPDAFMITARTDTGKTTTILRLLDQQRRATDTGSFLSDDLTLVSPDGLVMTYPKPLTISAHTVAAINTPRLSGIERLTLPLQSRLHSREGRKFALWLSQHRLPVATINTLVQLLVPPPKYHVQQLVPHARVTNEARLHGLIVIERGGDENVSLENKEGLDILLANCEDAYGFPPYETIKTFLHSSHAQDLPAIEREIIGQSLHNLPATLLRSSSMDWSRRIPMLVTGSAQREDWDVHERSVGGEMAVGLSST